MIERSLEEESAKLSAALQHRNRLTKDLELANRMSELFSSRGPIGDLLMLIFLRVLLGPQMDRDKKALDSILKDLK